MTEDTALATIVDSQSITRKRAEASIVRVGNRGLATDGRVHPHLITEFVKANAKNAWLPIKELTKQVTGSGSTDAPGASPGLGPKAPLSSTTVVGSCFRSGARPASNPSKNQAARMAARLTSATFLTV